MKIRNKKIKINIVNVHKTEKNKRQMNFNDKYLKIINYLEKEELFDKDR